MEQEGLPIYTFISKLLEKKVKIWTLILKTINFSVFFIFKIGLLQRLRYSTFYQTDLLGD